MKYMGSKNRIAKYILPIIERMADAIEYDGVLYGQMGNSPMADHIEEPPGEKQIYHQGRGPEADS